MNFLFLAQTLKSMRYKQYELDWIFLSVDCIWKHWTSWGSCTKSCDGGMQRATRVILEQPQYGGKDCIGGATKEQSCNTKSCPSCFFQDVSPAPGSTLLGRKRFQNHGEDAKEEYENANKTAEGCQELCQVRDYETCQFKLLTDSEI